MVKATTKPSCRWWFNSTSALQSLSDMDNQYLNIAIVGAGNVGVAMSADLSFRGYVTLVKSSSSNIHSAAFQRLCGKDSQLLIKENGSIKSTIITECTDDLSTIAKADVVIITVQTQYHEELVKKLAPYLHREQILILVPSYMGAFYFKRVLRENTPAIVEMTGPPVEGRIELDIDPYHCVFRVGSRLKKNIVAVLPNGKSITEIKSVLNSLGYPFEISYNSVQAGLLNPNLILHTAGSILSIPRIENAKESFCMYHEAYTRDNIGMMRIVEALDQEKNNVLNALGFPSVAFLQSADFWGARAMEKFLDYAASDSRANAPTSIHSRYITEDVSQGLVLLESVAKFIHVDTPLTSALISIASSALDIDFRKEGRTISRLGAEVYLLTLTQTA